MMLVAIVVMGTINRCSMWHVKGGMWATRLHKPQFRFVPPAVVGQSRIMLFYLEWLRSEIVRLHKPQFRFVPPDVVIIYYYYYYQPDCYHHCYQPDCYHLYSSEEVNKGTSETNSAGEFFPDELLYQAASIEVKMSSLCMSNRVCFLPVGACQANLNQADA